MNQVSSELANGLNVGNEENGEFQISLLSGWWAVFTEIKKTGKEKKKKDWEENVFGRKPRVQLEM